MAQKPTCVSVNAFAMAANASVLAERSSPSVLEHTLRTARTTRSNAVSLVNYWQ
jgi:hypothetical protein